MGRRNGRDLGRPSNDSPVVTQRRSDVRDGERSSFRAGRSLVGPVPRQAISPTCFLFGACSPGCYSPTHYRRGAPPPPFPVPFHHPFYRLSPPFRPAL